MIMMGVDDHKKLIMMIVTITTITIFITNSHLDCVLGGLVAHKDCDLWNSHRLGIVLNF